MRVTRSNFSTVTAPPDQRAALLSAYCREHMTAFRVRTLGSDGVNIEVCRVSFPDIELLEMAGDGYLVERTPELIDENRSRMIQIGMLLRGRSFICHSNRIEVLSRGDISFYDADTPGAYGVSNGYHEVVLCVSHDFFATRYGERHPAEPTLLHPPNVEKLVARAEELLVMMRMNVTEDPERAADVSRTAVALLDDVLGEGVPGFTGPWIEAREYIRSQAPDSTLSVRRVAEAVSMSERKLARIFAARGTSVSRLITEERMRQARSMLLDPRNVHRPISEIAKEVGFVSPSHFARTFRRVFGTSAHALRAADRVDARG